jgi:hypothetical protein
LADSPEPARPTSTQPSDLKILLAVLGALLLVGLAVGGLYWLVMRLKAAGDLQDCVASGRRNCGQSFPQY